MRTEPPDRAADRIGRQSTHLFSVAEPRRARAALLKRQTTFLIIGAGSIGLC